MIFLLDPGTRVGMVTAHDADSGPHGHVTYSLLYNTDAEESFSINEQTGIITTTRPLDREMHPEHRITIIASDLAMPPLTSTVTVIVVIDDVNDNAPEFPVALRTNNTFYVSPQAGRGYVVTLLRAVDRDEGQNAVISYELLGERFAPDLFVVNPELGIVSVSGVLSDLDGGLFELKVTARDKGIPSRFASIFLFVHVNSSTYYVGEGDKGKFTSSVMHQNLAIVVSVAVVSGIITVCLITAIVLLRQKDRRRSKGELVQGGNGCRMEQLGGVLKNGNKSGVRGDRGSIDELNCVGGGKGVKCRKGCGSVSSNGGTCYSSRDQYVYKSPGRNYQVRRFG